jgi:hypothetical protein
MSSLIEALLGQTVNRSELAWALGRLISFSSDGMHAVPFAGGQTQTRIWYTPFEPLSSVGKVCETT